MKSEGEVITQVLRALDEAGVPHMIVGSFAASIHGVSRATHDLDLVIAITQEAVHSLAENLGDDFFLDEEPARNAVCRKEMFNAVHYATGLKIDFWMEKDDEFSRVQFQRRMPVDALGTRCYVQTAEDTVLSKLLWYRIGPSERQLSDIRGVLATGRDALDYEYIRRWAIELGVSDMFDQLIEETDG